MSAYVVGIGLVFAQSAQSNNAKLQLQTASNAYAQAYSAVSDAEKAGANVTFLINQLDNAGGSLSQADVLYARGDFNGTVAAAAAAVLGIQSISSQAQSLKTAAQTSSRNAFWALIAFSVVAVVVFLSVLFLVWRYVKSSYWKNISEAKPEVINE